MPANPAEIPRERDTDVFGALERYACTPNPETLSPAVHHAHDAKTVTIYDAYPKSKYHLLVLPRPREGVVTVPDLLNLRTLLNGDKERAKRVLDEMGVAAEAAKKDVREEMQRQWGFQWDVWIGFHALPSMRHLHIHVMSADLCMPAMKKKKHYNTFHPKLGFFLHYTDVMEWFDATPSYYDRKVRELRPSVYEDLLKTDLECFKCEHTFKTMPALKNHLQEEFDTMKTRGRERAAREKEILEKLQRRKRKLEERKAEGGEEEGSAASLASTSTAGTGMQPQADDEDAVASERDGAVSPPHKRQET